MPNTVLSDSETTELEINYWKEKLRGATPLHLPCDQPARGFKTIKKGKFNFLIAPMLCGQLDQLAEEQGIGLSILLLTTFTVFLYRYTNQEDIALGNVLPVFADGKLKFPLNKFILRVPVNGDIFFNQFLRQVNAGVEDAGRYGKASWSDIEHDNTLLNALFVFTNEKTNNVDLLPDQVEFALAIEERDGELYGSIIYDENLFNKDTISRMAGHYQQLLSAAVNNPDKAIGALPMLTLAEEKEILYKFNDTLKPYCLQYSLPGLFEEQAAKTPDAIALRQHDEEMTYSELNARANQLAQYLISNGVNKGDNIGLIATRGFNMIIGMYGIMKAGGAYVPIDPEYPIERQEYILGNSSVTKIIADGEYPLENPISAEQFINLGTLDLDTYSKVNLDLEIDSKQLAYTIYTSGSTGRPKGVMIEHHSAVNLIEWVNTEFNIGGADRLLFITSMCFDLSVYDIFGMLAAGGSVVIVEQQELMDVPKLKDMMLKHKITFWDSVPTTMDYLIRELESQENGYVQDSLRVVFMSGDWIPVNLPDRIKKYFPNAKVISLGGATEGTIWSNYYPIDKIESTWHSIPYGKPLNNNFFYILNDQLQPAPIGVAGELYIGGVGVARGYANDPEKTTYSFVKDPFNNNAGGRMYRTGDLGRMLPDMNMEFIGRKDNQVKIRGYRIELGEIESVLKQSAMIREVAVLAKNDKEGKKRLISYVVGKEQYDREMVISFLKNKLPDYMIPALWIELDSLPLTSNGKIDRKALPDFNAEEQLKSNYMAPVTESEKTLAEIWKQVLKLGSVGIHDNFFDIGGHSLLAVQIMTKIGKKTGKKYPIATLFRYPTVASLSAFMQEEDAEHNWRSIVPIKASGSKTPLYIVHGAGLNVLNFNDLASNVDREQPIFGLQGIGLDGLDAPLDSIQSIASFYVNEVIKHNTTGPYLIAGYSIGGFIAVEMVRQLKEMNREVKMLAIFDTDAENARDSEPWYVILPKVMKRYLPRFLGGRKSLTKQIIYLFRHKTGAVADKVGVGKKSAEYYTLLDKAIKKYFAALENYELQPINETVHLFKAEINDHYNDDEEYLGWKKFALNGVTINRVSGNHLDMLMPPNVAEFGAILQKALDNCYSGIKR